jgi:membrane protein YqaA with SNARE-associated domain
MRCLSNERTTRLTRRAFGHDELLEHIAIIALFAAVVFPILAAACKRLRMPWWYAVVATLALITICYAVWFVRDWIEAADLEREYETSTATRHNDE